MNDCPSSARVFVVGSLNADHRVHVDRIPAPGETVRASASAVAAGGKGANQAVAAARAGAVTTIIGAVGDDGDGLIVRRALAEQDIDTSHVRVLPEAPTGRALITVDAHGENSIVVSPGANGKLTSDDIDAGLRGIGPGDLLLLQLETPEWLVRHAARVGHDAGSTVVLNPTPVPDSPDGLFDDVDLLIVNEHELARLAGDIVLLAHNADAAVICTAGDDGAFVTQRDRVAHIVAPMVHAVDTTAAGDTFIGYLAARLAAAPNDILGAAHIAVQAAGLAVTRGGAIDSIPYGKELQSNATTAEGPR
jgi:ribokinase